MRSKRIDHAGGRLWLACAMLAVAAGLLIIVAGCASPAAPSPTAQPGAQASPAASEPAGASPAVPPPTPIPTQTIPAPMAVPPAPAQGGQEIDAGRLVLTGADLGPGWKPSDSQPTPAASEASSLLEWSGTGGEMSPEGLSAVSSQVVVHPDGASARAAMVPLDGEHTAVSAPEVGDASRAYTRSVNGGSSVVYLEAVRGNVWLRVGVSGDPRSEVKVPRAAQLAERVLSRLDKVLTVEEHPIAEAATARPDRMEYSRLIDRAILEKRRPWREPAPEARVAATNALLAPFGYRIAIEEGSQPGGPLFSVFEGDSQVAADIAYFGDPSVTVDGSDFAMVLEPATGPASLLRRGSMEEWDVMQHAMARPVFVGTDLVAVVLDSQPSQQAGSQRFAITREGEAVYPFDAPFVVDNPIKGLWSWGGHWVLEVATEVMVGEVIVDGVSLNQAIGYDEVFGWRLLRGEPFYFFRKDGRVGISYAGQAMEGSYDEVIHYQCCEPAAFNVRSNDSMVWFHALSDGTWHYVEAGVFDSVPGAGLPPVDGATGSRGPKD